MNVEKNPRHARKLAREQAALARKARRLGKDNLSGRERARLENELIFENVEDFHETEIHAAGADAEREVSYR